MSRVWILASLPSRNFSVAFLYLMGEQPVQGYFPRLPKALEASPLQSLLAPEIYATIFVKRLSLILTATAGQRLHTDRTIKSVALELSDCESETRNYKG
jgi:hypothetical protein